MLQDQGVVMLDQFSQTFHSRVEADSWTSPSRTYSTADGPFNVSPWVRDDEDYGNDFFRLQDLCTVLQSSIFNEASSSSGSGRRGNTPKTVSSFSATSRSTSADDGGDHDNASILILDEEVIDISSDVDARRPEVESPPRSPEFEMRVFDPGSTEYETSNEYSAEMIESAVEEWNGKAHELCAIDEEESASAEAMDVIFADLKRRSSDTEVQSPASSNSHGIRRVSTMSDYQRLKGRHKSPKLVAFKTGPASPAMTAVSVQPAEAWKISSSYQESTDHPQSTAMPIRRTSQTFQSDLGISQMVWEEPSSSSDSAITVLTGSGIDYLVANAIEEEYGIPSPMERLKTKLKAWSWEREMAESSHDTRSAFIPLMSTEGRGHRR